MADPKRTWYDILYSGLIGRAKPADEPGAPARASNATILTAGRKRPDRSAWLTGVPEDTMDLRHAALPTGPTVRPRIDPTVASSHEHGVSGTAIFGGSITGEEYNAELTGQAGLEAYDKMRRSDAQVRATLQAMKLPLQAAVWEVMAEEGGDEIDDAIAKFVNECLIDDDALVDSWQFVLRHILLQLEFGFSLLEKVWRVDHDGFYRFTRLAPRLPKTVSAWHVDRTGKLVRVWQWAPVIKERPPAEGDTRIPQPPHATYEYIPIPGHALCVFTLDREGDNYEGISSLRSSYRNWFYKDLIYHLDGVRLDRYGVGIPMAKLDETHGLTDEDIGNLEDVLADLRSNERVYLIAPPGVDYKILTPDGGGGAASAASSLVEHHDTMISRNVLANFLTLGPGPLGSQVFGSRMTDLFISSLYGLAAGISADLKRSVVKPLCDLNFDMSNRQYPSVKVRDLEANDIEAMVKTIFEAVKAAVITPDDDLEAVLRKTLKLPQLPKELSRKQKAMEAEQAAAAAAPPTGTAPAPTDGGVDIGGLEEPEAQFAVEKNAAGLFDIRSPAGEIVGTYTTSAEAEVAKKRMMAQA